MSSTRHDSTRLARRRFLQQSLLAGSVSLVGSSRFTRALADTVAPDTQRRRKCIVLWMTGGPTQTDTFDMKPDHANGGEFKETATSVPGVRFSEHLPKLAGLADHLAIVRSLSTKEGDHERGAHFVRTGRLPGGPLRYPDFGALLSKELGRDEAELPNYVSIGSPVEFSPSAFGSGFLGPHYAPATVSVLQEAASGDSETRRFTQLGLDFLRPAGGAGSPQAIRRRQLWDRLQQDFLQHTATSNARAQDTAYRQAMKLMQSEAAAAFDLDQESASTREAYGSGRFGQGCLLARRLVERDVPFVEVALGGFGGDDPGWDTHLNNFPAVKRLCQQLDSGWSQLLIDLRDRGLLEDTTILWIGEFGRTPAINPNAGRDHFPAAWSCVLAGGGIRGGQAYGKTSADGMEVEEGKMAIPDLLATLCQAVGVAPSRENYTDIGRPIPLVEGGQPVADLLV